MTGAGLRNLPLRRFVMGNATKLSFLLGIIYQAFLGKDEENRLTEDGNEAIWLVEKLLEHLGIEIPWYFTQGKTQPEGTLWVANMLATLEGGNVSLYVDQLAIHSCNDRMGVSWVFDDLRTLLDLCQFDGRYTISHILAENSARKKDKE